MLLPARFFLQSALAADGRWRRLLDDTRPVGNYKDDREGCGNSGIAGNENN